MGKVSSSVASVGNWLLEFEWIVRVPDESAVNVCYLTWSAVGSGMLLTQMSELTANCGGCMKWALIFLYLTALVLSSTISQEVRCNVLLSRGNECVSSERTKWLYHQK